MQESFHLPLAGSAVFLAQPNEKDVDSAQQADTRIMSEMLDAAETAISSALSALEPDFEVAHARDLARAAIVAAFRHFGRT